MRALLFFLGAVVMSVSTASLPFKPSLAFERMSKEKMLRFVKDIANSEENASSSCVFCTMFVDGLQQIVASNKTDDEVAGFIVTACDSLNYEQPYVCQHLVSVYQEEIVFVLERTLFTPHEICGAFLKNCGTAVDPLQVIWNITIPDGKPPVRPWPKIPEGRPTLKVLHLSDIHVDRQYAVGSEAYCELDNIWGSYSLCCPNYNDTMGATSRKDKPIHVPAQQWGMPYNCDIPFRTFENALQHIRTTHKDLFNYFSFDLEKMEFHSLVFV